MKYLNKNLIKKPMEFTKMLKNGKNNFSLINLICFFIYFWRSRVYRLIMKHTRQSDQRKIAWVQNFPGVKLQWIE